MDFRASYGAAEAAPLQGNIGALLNKIRRFQNKIGAPSKQNGGWGRFHGVAAWNALGGEEPTSAAKAGWDFRASYGAAEAAPLQGKIGAWDRTPSSKIGAPSEQNRRLEALSRRSSLECARSEEATSAAKAGWDFKLTYGAAEAAPLQGKSARLQNKIGAPGFAQAWTAEAAVAT